MRGSCVLLLAILPMTSMASAAHAQGAPPPSDEKRSGVFDDSTRPAPQAAAPKRSGIFDDSTKPLPKGADPKRGGIWDDSTRPKPERK